MENVRFIYGDGSVVYTGKLKHLPKKGTFKKVKGVNYFIARCLGECFEDEFNEECQDDTLCTLFEVQEKRV